MKNPDEKCETCKFEDNGICLRYPPQAYAGEKGNYWNWPIVELDDYCGEWQKD